MSIFGRFYQNYRRDAIKFVTAAATLTPVDRVVEATATAAWAITLPPVSECAGQVYTIHAEISSSGAVTVQDQNDSIDWTDRLLDADLDGVCLFSDGRKWWVICNDVSLS